MSPTFTIPSDNIYKFACIFGLALIVVATISFVTMYTSALDRKVRYSEIIITLEAKAALSNVEKDVLELNKRLLKVAQSNERTANSGIGILFGVGILLSAAGAYTWHQKVQLRDDRLVQLQMRKIEAEIAMLEAEVNSLSHESPSKQA